MFCILAGGEIEWKQRMRKKGDGVKKEEGAWKSIRQVLYPG